MRVRVSTLEGLVIAAIAAGGCGVEAPPPPVEEEPSWALYTIEPGTHAARLTGRELSNPLDGVSGAAGRDYLFILDPTARYELLAPVQPDDQLDWNKLPGLSDCGTVDLAVDGAMFGWRWRTDVPRGALELTAYANNERVHLTAAEPLVVLDDADLAAEEPLHFRVSREATLYRFEIDGEIRGRSIAAQATLPRRCPTYPLDETVWASGFYFGGTSTAPHRITARIRETPFAP
jgi:hypothetical protein